MNHDRIYRYCLANPWGTDALSWDRMIRDHRFSIPYDRRAVFYEIMGFVADHKHVFHHRTTDPASCNGFQEFLDQCDSDFVESEVWLRENCPSFTRLGPLVGIQDDTEAFAFRLRFQ